MINSGNFTIKYDAFNTPHQYGGHFHNSHEIIFIKEGCASFLISDKEYEACANSIIFINSFESHKSKIIKYPYSRYFILLDQKYLHASINDPMLLSIFKQRPSVFNHMIRLNESHANTVEQFMRNIHKEYNNMKKHTEEVISSSFSLMIIDLYRSFPEYFPGLSAGKSFETISYAEKYIEENFTGEISLKKIASILNIDMYYLSHLFKKVTGYGFKEYIIYQRLSKAKETLIKTNSSIVDVCLNSGFRNVNHFIRLFKQKEGITPLKYRKKWQ